jgi:hypothetical protein
MKNGTWGRQPGGDDLLEDGTDLHGDTVQRGVRLVVRDTRNLLIVGLPMAIATRPELAASLQYALLRGIATAFQLEEQELSSERLGVGVSSRLIFWEAAEGGAGVLRRLVEEPDALARAARAALDVCHFQPDGRERDDAGECTRACYRCLLSYSNQPDHALLDRQAIRDLLVELAQAQVAPQRHEGHEEAYVARDLPAELPDNLPPAAARVLAAIRGLGGREPDAILPEVIGFHPHLAYQPTYFILCPEPGESIAEMQTELEDAGCSVIVIGPTDDVAAALAAYAFWKGD